MTPLVLVRRSLFPVMEMGKILATESCLSSNHPKRNVLGYVTTSVNFSTVAVMLSIAGSALSARFAGPYKICEHLTNMDYMNREIPVCHVNILTVLIPPHSFYFLGMAGPNLLTPLWRMHNQSVAGWPLIVQDSNIEVCPHPLKKKRCWKCPCWRNVPFIKCLIYLSLTVYVTLVFRKPAGLVPGRGCCVSFHCVWAM